MIPSRSYSPNREVSWPNGGLDNVGPAHCQWTPRGTLPLALDILWEADMNREAKMYVFWAHRGPFRWVSPNWVRESEILEIGRGSAHLLKPQGNVEGLRRTVVFGFTAFGSVLGTLDYWLLTASGLDLPLRLLLVVASVLATATLVPVEERAFVRYLARDSERPGFEVHLARAEYHRYIHRLDVRAGNQLFGVTVLGVPRRVRAAVALASEVA